MMSLLRKLFRVNKASNRVMIQCASNVDKSAIKREIRDGVEHIIITSKTLPNDIVMNGMLYPAEEIAKGFDSLERTLAPVEHPHDTNGDFLTALDPVAINNFHVGAHNENVRQENGRVVMDKVINVQTALTSEKGRRLLDRVNEIETSDTPRPIHTSVGLFLEVEDLKEIQTNNEGESYKMIGRNFVFDHDAILLDTIGAAQPHQGVGLAVNDDGTKIKVQKTSVAPPVVNELSHSEIRDELSNLVRAGTTSDSFAWVMEVFDDNFIYEVGEGTYFKDFYTVEGDEVKIVGNPFEIKREVTYVPITNEEDAMRELILNALKEAGICSEGMSDEQLMEAHASLKVNAADPAPAPVPAPVVDAGIAEQVSKLTSVVEALIANQNQEQESELDKLADIVVNAKKVDLTKDELKKLGVEALRKLVGNAGTSVGIPFAAPQASGSNVIQYEMPA